MLSAITPNQLKVGKGMPAKVFWAVEEESVITLWCISALHNHMLPHLMSKKGTGTYYNAAVCCTELKIRRRWAFQ